MIDVRPHTVAALLASLSLSSGCSRTVVLEPAVAEPGEIAFGAESHERLFLGMPTKKTVATGIAATSPPEPRPLGDALWRVRRAGSRLQYCEAASQSCQEVWFGDKRKVRTGVMVIVDPVNRGGYLQVGSSNPFGPSPSSKADRLVAGEIQAPYTPNRAVWVKGSVGNDLWYCGVEVDGPICRQAGLEGAPGQIFFTGVIYADALRTPDGFEDVVWLQLGGLALMRCEASAAQPTPVCKVATMRG